MLLVLPAWRRGAALSLVEFSDDGLDDVLHLLLLSLEVLSLGLGIVLQPLDLLVDDLLNFALLVFAQLASQLLLVSDPILQTVGVALELIPSLNLALQGGILLGKLLGIVDHPLDVLGAESVVVLGHRPLSLVHLDGDGVLVVSSSGEDLGLL